MGLSLGLARSDGLVLPVEASLRIQGTLAAGVGAYYKDAFHVYFDGKALGDVEL